MSILQPFGRISLSVFRYAPLEATMGIGIVLLVAGPVIGWKRDTAPSSSVKELVFRDLACDGFFIPRRTGDERVPMDTPEQRYEGFFRAALATGKGQPAAREAARAAVKTCEDFGRSQ